MAITLIALAVSVVIVLFGAVWFRVSNDRSRNRREAFRRAKALVWGTLVGGLIAGLFLVIGLVWYIIGVGWMFVTGSSTLVPGDRWSRRFERFLSWPYEQLIFAITGKGSFVLWP